MDDDVREELRSLRARAYGPDADIATDPSAVQRLRELEELDRRPPAPPERADADRPPGPVGSDAEVPASDPSDEFDASDDETAPNRRPLLRSRRSVWIAAAALAGVAVVASVATAVGTSFTAVDRTAGIAQVDALTPAPDLQIDFAGYLGFDPEQTRGYADYYGLTAFAGPTQIDSEGNRAECLLLSDTDDMNGSDSGARSSGVRSGGCGAGPFPATVEFIVTPSFPAEFRARFPVGSAVQFVLDGDDVGVFSDAD